MYALQLQYILASSTQCPRQSRFDHESLQYTTHRFEFADLANFCLLYTSDAADEEDSVDLGGRRIIKKKTVPNCFTIDVLGIAYLFTLHFECQSSSK